MAFSTGAASGAPERAGRRRGRPRGGQREGSEGGGTERVGATEAAGFPRRDPTRPPSPRGAAVTGTPSARRDGRAEAVRTGWPIASSVGGRRCATREVRVERREYTPAPRGVQRGSCRRGRRPATGRADFLPRRRTGFLRPSGASCAPKARPQAHRPRSVPAALAQGNAAQHAMAARRARRQAARPRIGPTGAGPPPGSPSGRDRCRTRRGSGAAPRARRQRRA
jgi:hypothetical protein